MFLKVCAIVHNISVTSISSRGEERDEGYRAPAGLMAGAWSCEKQEVNHHHHRNEVKLAESARLAELATSYILYCKIYLVPPSRVSVNTQVLALLLYSGTVQSHSNLSTILQCTCK